MFGSRTARRSLERYRQHGLDDLGRQMVESASAGGLRGARVLDIGGGIGAIQAELLAAGAERGEIVELVSAYEPFALELAREKGLEGRVAYRVKDVLEQSASIEASDIVVLNRVVCCSPDGLRLTGMAARLARRTLVLSFPRDRLLVRVGIRLVNASMAAFGRSFRAFVYPRSALLAAAEGEGLRLEGGDRSFLWEFVDLRRPA